MSRCSVTIIDVLTGFKFIAEQMEMMEETAAQCRLLQPHALLMEVTGYTPWKLSERLKIRDSVRRDVPECRIVLMVDEIADRKLAEEVKRAKQEGLVDAFFYASATESYLAAVLDSL